MEWLVFSGRRVWSGLCSVVGECGVVGVQW